jgi:acid phosphatase type 7
MNNKISLILSVLAFILIFAFLGWLFSLHGIRGLLHVEMIAWAAVVLLALLGIIPLVQLFIKSWFRKKHPVITVTIMILSSISIIIPVVAFPYLEGFPSSTIINTFPRLFMTASTGSFGIPDIAVVTQSRTPSRYILTWGKSEIEFTTSKDDTNSTGHIFVLHDLEPDTEYWYRLNNGPEYHFTTPGIASQTLHFAVGSDAHFGASDNRPDLTSEMLAQIADPANGFDYFFSLGDNVEYGFRAEVWRDALTALSITASTIPTAFAAGNHDTLFIGLDRYLDYCSPIGIDYVNDTQLWHRFDVGNIHFLILDIEWSAETFTAQQQTWLESELKSIPANDWTIVMSHGFYYASGSMVRGWKWYDNTETIRKLTPLFEKYSVDLVFSGHNHQMELLEKSGVTYVIVGSFGGLPDPTRTYTSPASQWYASGQYGFVDITIKANQAHLTFRDPDSRELKTAVVEKR